MSKKSYKRTVKVDFDYSDVLKGVPDVNRAMAELDAKFKAQVSEAEKAGEKTKALSLGYDRAGKAAELHARKVDILTQELQDLENAADRDEKAIHRKKVALDKATAAMNKAEKEARDLNREIQKQSGFLGDSADKWKTYGDKMANIGKTLTTHVTLPIVAMGAGAIKMASDMQENLQKVDAVFKESSKTIRDWSESSLENMGLARSTALDMTALFGDMATSVGIPVQQSAEMSMRITQLAADLASFKNIKIEVAQTALSGIFTGETESLKKLGVVMTEANLQQYAYTQGISKKISEMSQSEKVMLRYNFVLEQTKNAHGDFERTGGGAANQMRIFQESVKELGAELGENFLPLFTELVKSANGFLKEMKNLPEPVQDVIIGIAALAAIIGPVLLVLGTFAKALVSINSALVLLKGGGFAAALGIKEVGIVSTIAAKGVGFFSTGLGAAALAAGKFIAIGAAIVAAMQVIIHWVSKALDWFQKLTGQYDDYLRIKKLQEGVSTSYSQYGIRTYAIGTQYSRAGIARVHEYGDEIIEMPSGARVYTAEQSRQMLSNQGNAETNKQLQDLIHIVSSLAEKVEHLPDRQQQLARE